MALYKERGGRGGEEEEEGEGWERLVSLHFFEGSLLLLVLPKMQIFVVAVDFVVVVYLRVSGSFAVCQGGRWPIERVAAAVRGLVGGETVDAVV